MAENVDGMVGMQSDIWKKTMKVNNIVIQR